MGSKSKVKTWDDEEILTHTDLNAEIDNIYSSPMALISPCDATLDLNGQVLILDGNQDTTITADTDDVIDFKCQGFDAFKMDGDVALPVNGLSFISSATGVAPQITDHGEINTGINLVPAGTGTIQIDGGVLAGKCLNGSALWNIASLTQGATEQDETTFTVSGAALGDFCLASLAVSNVRVSLYAFVSSADNVTVIANNLGTNIDIAETTVYVRVFSRT